MSRGQGGGEARRLRWVLRDGTASRKVVMGTLDIWAGSPVDVGLGAESWGGGPGQARHTPLGLGTSVDQ